MKRIESGTRPDYFEQRQSTRTLDRDKRGCSSFRLKERRAVAITIVTVFDFLKSKARKSNSTILIVRTRHPLHHDSIATSICGGIRSHTSALTQTHFQPDGTGMRWLAGRLIGVTPGPTGIEDCLSAVRAPTPPGGTTFLESRRKSSAQRSARSYSD